MLEHINNTTNNSASDAARLTLDVASEKNATDIILMDMRSVCSFTDYFVVATAESRRQMQALVDDIDDTLRKFGTKSNHIEGTTEGGWILLDYVDFIVHVFSPEERDNYQIEKYWRNAPVIFKIQ
tara:strand:+ start:119 stop:493 length:375 start_codon:yes stop_codon:yes gene_type:complete